jgi:catechol 2,3-dioxygenase-like lactoylglutathione lyase family enzyme
MLDGQVSRRRRSAMLDHIGIPVRDPQASKTFYSAALAPLGIAVMMDFGEAVGLGSEGKPFFWLGKSADCGKTHIAFSAPDRKTVDAFHAAAIAAGGQDNGAPGVRAQYHPSYYGAFVIDPDGHNLEAVCHRPE